MTNTAVRIMYLVFFLALFQVTNTQRVPELRPSSFAVPILKAKKGDDVTLRCSIQFAVDGRVPICRPDYEDCVFKWTKGSIEYTNSSYEIITNITTGFCATFEMTTSKFKSLTASTLLKWPHNHNSYNTYDFACYTTTITILDVRDEDFGTYHCNFSERSDNAKNGFSSANITLVDVNGAVVEMPKRMLLSQKMFWGYPDGVYTFQCIFSGVQKLYWYIDYCNRNTRYGKTCQYTRISGLDFSNSDIWIGFDNVTVQYNPYSEVVESFLVIGNMTATDEIFVSCSSEEDPVFNKGEAWMIYGPSRSGPGGWVFDLLITITISSTCILIVLIWIGCGITACKRANICCQRNV